MLTFYYSTQTCSTAVHIALEEAGLPFQGVEVSWRRNVNVDKLEAVNPLGQVPVIVESNRKLNQSIAILEMIADRASGRKLLPAAGTWERTEALSWLSFIGADLQKNFAPFVLAARWTANESAQADIKRAASDTLAKQLAYVDRSLAGKDFILGNEFSVVDAYLFTILGWCKWAEVNVSPYPNIQPYLRRVMARPAVQKVLAKEELLDFLPA